MPHSIFSNEDDTFQRSPKRQRQEATWPMHIQRAFVEAIYKVGLHASSPNTIIENMALKSYDIVGDQVRKGQDITGEHVKSHLQKHRKKPDKALKEFMLSYDSAMAKLDSIPTLDIWNQRDQPEMLLENAIVALGCKPSLLLGAEPAAFLSLCSNPFLHPSGYDNTCESTAERDLTHSPANITIEEFHPKDPLEMLERCTSLSIPILTEDEKKSALGKTLTFIMGMFDSFKQHILDHRRHQQHLQKTKSINNHSILIKRNLQEMNRDLSSRASITPIDMDNMSKAYFVYEPSQSSLTRLTRTSQQDFSLKNEIPYHFDQYEGEYSTQVIKTTRGHSSTPRIDNCYGHFNTTYELSYDFKPCDNQIYEHSRNAG